MGLLFFFSSIVLGLLSLKILVILLGKRKKGLPIPMSANEFSPFVAKGEKGLFYFYRPGCIPCREMTPIVDEIRYKYQNVVKINVDENNVVAKEFGIRGTPSVVYVEGGIIRDCFFGPCTEKKLCDLISQ